MTADESRVRLVKHPETYAPVVRIRATGRHVLLLAWHQDKHGTWHAHVAWLARQYVTWRGIDVWMRAEDLEPVDGEDYRDVPRTSDEPDF